jgi:hypothetical protein
MPTPPTSFGEITSNKCVTNNNVVAQNIEKYVDRVIKSEVAGQAGYWNSNTTTLTDNDLTTNTVPDFFWKYLTAQEFGSDVLKINTSHIADVPIVLFPPKPSDLITYLAQKFKRTIAVGDTYTLTITNSSTVSGVFLATSKSGGEYSSANSNYNGWLGRIINANTSVAFWIRITDVSTGGYELVRPNIVYPKVTTTSESIPTNQGQYGDIIEKIKTNTDQTIPVDPYWASKEPDFYTTNDTAQDVLNNQFPTEVL